MPQGEEYDEKIGLLSEKEATTTALDDFKNYLDIALSNCTKIIKSKNL